MWNALLHNMIGGDIRALSRAISLIENETIGYEEFLKKLPSTNICPIIGITGPPGAGKSTLTDALLEQLLLTHKKIAVLCIDPSSPFHFGSILGDRIRMNQWYNNPNVFIRSLASRGSLGGLCPMVIEITELLKSAGFDMIIIETVGVGQTEVEIAGIADTTVVVLVPESGDDIQSMKAGLMEIADIFVVNKADRPGAATLENNLKHICIQEADHEHHSISVVSVIAVEKKGVNQLANEIIEHFQNNRSIEKQRNDLADKIIKLILKKKMSKISRTKIVQDITALGNRLNLFEYADNF